MTPSDPLVKAALARANYFVSIGVWPGMRSIDVNGWISNFTRGEMAHASALLNHFLYYSGDLTRALLISAFTNLSSLRRIPGDDPRLIAQKWGAFREELILTWVEGEIPGPTDSGLVFARIAKRSLGIREEQIKEPDLALRMSFASKRPLVFVDDFVGSGQQMEKTWTRKREIAQDLRSSFLEEAQISGLDATYIPCIATTHGMQHIATYCPSLLVAPAHILDPRENVFALDSSAWPEALLPTAVDFLETCSRRAGIADDDIKGYCDLGLALAYEHSIPDATIPLLRHESRTWRPLVRPV